MSTNGRGRHGRSRRDRSGAGGERGWWNLPADVVAGIEAAVELSRSGGFPWPPGPPGSGAMPALSDPDQAKPADAASVHTPYAPLPGCWCPRVVRHDAMRRGSSVRIWHQAGCPYVSEADQRDLTTPGEAGDAAQDGVSSPARPEVEAGPRIDRDVDVRRAFVLAIVGSRSLAGSEEAERTLGEVLDRYQAEHAGKDLVVISGGARGIDRIAIAEAGRRGLLREELLADGHDWPAYRARDLVLAQRCDALVRIADRHSRTYGSGWTRDRARELGKPTEEVVIDGRPPARTPGRAGREAEVQVER